MTLTGLIINEAIAREKLGDTFGALAAVDAATSSETERADVRALRERLQTGGSPSFVAARDDGSLERVPNDSVPNSALTRQVGRAPAEPDDAVDIAIITALPEEYAAVRRRLTDCQPAPPDDSQYKNLYAWALGSIPKADGNGAQCVVVALAGQSGNTKAFAATLRTVERWRPTYVLFSGIAGGLKKDDLKQGDIVLSRTIWNYEYGKIENGEYHPRHRDSFPTHTGLLNSAQVFEGATREWHDCGQSPPAPGHVPRCIPGMIGSGDKVLDDLEPAFVQAILKARPELQAIEMEAAGAVSAIELLRNEGQPVGFMMVRGISDLPGNATGMAGAGTEERDTWKVYAAEIAAHFVACWIASQWWPFAQRRGSIAIRK